ncbi:MAG: YfiR family protein [Planctomycetes bacterium]|nr:YfiR family protein [Planctomycetota bacterium]
MTVFAETPAAHGQGQVVDREYVLKAVYLYRFATYIRWPDKAFADANSPFVIAVFGPDPVGDGLREIAAQKKIGERKIVVRHFEQPGDVRDCHILFMTRAVDSETQKAIIQRLSKQGVLFVGETKEFLQHGGVIDFLIRQNQIRMFISKRAYEREGLKVSAQLLRVMTVLE